MKVLNREGQPTKPPTLLERMERETVVVELTATEAFLFYKLIGYTAPNKSPFGNSVNEMYEMFASIPILKEAEDHIAPKSFFVRSPDIKLSPDVLT